MTKVGVPIANSSIVGEKQLEDCSGAVASYTSVFRIYDQAKPTFFLSSLEFCPVSVTG